MAKRTSGEYKIVTLDFEQLLKAGNQSWSSGKLEANINRLISVIERGMKGTVGEGGFLFNRDRYEVNPQTGAGKLPIVIKQEYEKQALEMLKYVGGKEFGQTLSNKFMSGINVEDAVKVEIAKSTVAGKKAQNALIAEASKAGGYAEILPPTKAHAERVKATLFTSASDTRTDSELWAEAFTETTRLSKSEKKARKIAEKERKEIELARGAEAEEKRLAKEEAQSEREQDKLRKNDEKRLAKEEKDKQARHARLLGTVAKVIGTLTVIADIARRILTASIRNASEQTKLAVKATDMEVGYPEARQFGFFETSKGLPKGTILGAIGALQGKFGDVTNLDEKALGTLARVMGASVEDMVRSGMGGKEPERLMESILDKFFKQWKEGKNSLGQNVGQADARRELVTVLRQISPELASMFSKWTSDYSMGVNAGRGDTWSEYSRLQKFAVLPVSTQMAVTETGQLVDKVNGMIENFKQNVMAELTVSFSGLIRAIENSTLGMSPSEKQDVWASNRDINLITNKKYKDIRSFTQKQILTKLSEDYGIKGASYDENGILTLPGNLEYRGLIREAVKKGDIKMIELLEQANVAQNIIDMSQQELNKPLGKEVNKVTFAEATFVHTVNESMKTTMKDFADKAGYDEPEFMPVILPKYKEKFKAQSDGSYKQDKDFIAIASILRKGKIDPSLKKAKDEVIYNYIMSGLHEENVNKALLQYGETGQGKSAHKALFQGYIDKINRYEDESALWGLLAVSKLNEQQKATLRSAENVTYDFTPKYGVNGQLTGEAEVTIHVWNGDNKQDFKVPMNLAGQLTSSQAQ